jgi:hypothetical protein
MEIFLFLMFTPIGIWLWCFGCLVCCIVASMIVDP